MLDEKQVKIEKNPTEIKIDRIKQAITAKLEILALLDYEFYQPKKNELENISKNDEEGFKQLLNLSRELTTKILKLANVSASYYNDEVTQCLDKKIEDKKFEEILNNHKRALSSYLEDILEKKLDTPRENFLKFAYSAGHEFYFLEDLLTAIKNASLRDMEKLQPLENLFKPLEEAFSETRANYNIFVNKKSKTKSNEVNLIKNYGQKFVDVKNKIEFLLVELAKLYDGLRNDSTKQLFAAVTQALTAINQSAGKSQFFKEGNRNFNIVCQQQLASLKIMFEDKIPGLKFPTVIVEKELDNTKMESGENKRKSKLSGFFKSEKRSSQITEVVEEKNEFDGLANLISDVNKKLSHILVGKEYKLVNKLAYNYFLYIQKSDSEEIKNARFKDLQNSINAILALENSDIVQSFLEKNTSHEITSENISAYAKGLLETFKTHEFSPAGWAATHHIAADTEYPSSSKDRSEVWSANRHRVQGKTLIASAGPVPDKRAGQQRLEKFFACIMQEKPRQILSLGLPDKDFINYVQDATYGKYQVKITKQPHGDGIPVIIINVNDGQEKHEVYYHNISVADNHSINLDFKDMQKLLAIYKNWDIDNPLEIHCASGIGRTGQLTDVFVAYSDAKIKNLIIEFLRNVSSRNQDNGLELTKLHEGILNQIRQTRYSIQEKVQLLNCLPMMILLNAVELNYEEKQYQSLRQEVNKVWAVSPGEKVNDFTTFTAAIPAGADIRFKPKSDARSRSDNTPLMAPVKAAVGGSLWQKPARRNSITTEENSRADFLRRNSRSASIVEIQNDSSNTNTEEKSEEKITSPGQ